jgi:hypothetical protein
MERTNKMYYFMSVPIVLIFWLILNLMYSAPYVEVIPADPAMEEMFASPFFVFFFILGVLELVLIWKWVIPISKETGQHLLAYVFPEMPLVFGLIAAMLLQTITAYYYFLPLWLIAMAMVYREIYITG